MAVVVRAYELELLKDGDILKNLLEVDMNRIEAEFSKLWLDEAILSSTRRDDCPRLEKMIREIGEEYVKEELVSKCTLDKVLENISRLCDEIRG